MKVGRGRRGACVGIWDARGHEGRDAGTYGKGTGPIFFADAQQARLSFSPCVAFVMWAVFLVDSVLVDSGCVSINGDRDSIFYPLQQ